MQGLYVAVVWTILASFLSFDGSEPVVKSDKYYESNILLTLPKTWP